VGADQSREHALFGANRPLADASGTLKPDVTLAQAQLEMNVIARSLELEYPTTNKGIGKKVLPLHQELFGWLATCSIRCSRVAFVLLIACVNVANLMQFRTETRRKEYALRVSLGAGRSRLIGNC